MERRTLYTRALGMTPANPMNLLHLHSPRSSGPTLLQLLIHHSRTAVEGGGHFAWTTPAGARLLLEDKIFKRFLSGARFELLVGTDLTTTPESLETLRVFKERYPSLDIKAFVHDEAALFHPKLSWFKDARGDWTVINGSGNLTVDGLTHNFEATTLQYLDARAAGAVHMQLEEWTRAHMDCIRQLDDPEVLCRAELNSHHPVPRPPRARGQRPRPPAAPPPVAQPPATLTPEHDVLIAQVSHNRHRPEQIEINRWAIEQYFRLYQPNDFITAARVAPDGMMADLRTSYRVFSGDSQNYRIELPGRGNEVDTGQRPILVVLRSSGGLYLYCFVMSTQPGYEALGAFCRSEWRGPDAHLPKLAIARERLEALWPGCPLLHAVLPD